MSEISLIVTPGVIVPPDGTIDAGLLNMLGTPSVKLPGAMQLGPDQLDMRAISSSLGVGQNHLPWGDFYPSGWRAGSVPCPANNITATAANVWLFPKTAPVIAERVQASPNDQSAWAIKAIGSPNLTGLILGTYLTPDVCQRLKNQPIVVSLWIKNATGNTFVPTLKLATSNSLGDQDATTEIHVAESAVQAEPNSWRQHTWMLHTGGLLNWTLGAQLSVTLPPAADPAHHVLCAQWDIRIGASASAANTFSSPVREPALTTTVPTGTLLPFLGTVSVPPLGFLFADGAAISRTLYNKLFSLIGTTHGPGDGVTTFNLPDLRQRALMGAAAMGDALPVNRDSIPVTISITQGDDTIDISTAQDIPSGSLIVGPGLPEGCRVKGYWKRTTQLKLSAPATTGGLNIPAVIYPSGANTSAPYSPASKVWEPDAFVTKMVTASAGSDKLVMTDVDGFALEGVQAGMRVAGESVPTQPAPKVTGFSLAAGKFRVHLDQATTGSLANAPMRFLSPPTWAERQVMRERVGRYTAIHGCKTVAGSTDVTVNLWQTLLVGMKVSGFGIAQPSVIVDFPAAGKVRLDKPATHSSPDVLVEFESDPEHLAVPAFGQMAITQFILKY